MFSRFLFGLGISIYAFSLFTANDEEKGANYHDELTAKSCMGVRALIDLQSGNPAWFCEDFYREKGWLIAQ